MLDDEELTLDLPTGTWWMVWATLEKEHARVLTLLQMGNDSSLVVRSLASQLVRIEKAMTVVPHEEVDDDDFA